MRSLFYLSLIVAFLSSVLYAGQKPIHSAAKQKGQPLSLKVKTVSETPVEPIVPYAKYPIKQSKAEAEPQELMKRTASATNVYLDRSGHGYGWLNPLARKIDRWTGTDVQTGDTRDVLLIGYRGEQSDGTNQAMDICAAEVDVSAGLASGIGNVYVWEGFGTGGGSWALNNDLGGNGGRYPGVAALEYPFVFFNQYVGTTPTAQAAESHPYMITEYTTWLENGGAWTTPDFQMDNGWLDPDLNDLPDKVNRLWNGSVTVVKDADGVYHWCGVYETWFSASEEQFFGKQNHKNIMTAYSAPDDPTTWTYGWDVGNDPVLIDPNVVSLPRAGIAMNSNGFGVIAGPGHLGWHDPDSGYYYNETRITYSVTYDYGVTWSAWDTVGMVEDLGIPGYIHAEDKWIIWDIPAPGDTVWYDGPAFVGTNFDMSVMVDDNNTIYVAFNSLWGAYPPGEEGWYPNYRYSGVLLARKPEGGTWVGSRIAFNNGIWAGDDIISGRSNYFFDSEVQLSMDEQGNIYAAWLDRRHNQVQISNFQKYVDPEEATGYQDFKTDVYAAHSIDGGNYFSEPINCTDTPSLDEYELTMSIHSANQDARGDYGKIWFAYCLADTTVGNPNTDALIELPNDIWIGETSQFNPPAAVEEATPVLRSYALEQNYPNPFNPTTTIEFVPLKNEHATLTVFNTAGQKVATLFDGQVVKGQNYQVQFDAQNLASGVYFYKLQTEHNVEVKKMVLMK